nr:hypothetical protein [Natrialba taiwanensis]
MSTRTTALAMAGPSREFRPSIDPVVPLLEIPGNVQLIPSMSDFWLVANCIFEINPLVDTVKLSLRIFDLERVPAAIPRPYDVAAFGQRRFPEIRA